MKKQIDLFNAFFRIGIFGFGGGPTMIPLVHKEVVDNYKWMEDDEFSNVLAIGNTLPGPIATKMAGYIGYKVGGVTGCINAVFATIIPIIIVMIVGLGLLNEYRDTPWVKGMAMGVVPVVAWMMSKLCYDFFLKGYKAVGVISTAILSVASLILVLSFGVHPGLIVAAVILGVFIKPEKKLESKSTKQSG
ncbi:chromate transporter [Vibrio sp. SS-MA-C1-2]|uniref:chromate transporter n=1 Tax=Vibrio sp. SS-MA-C1-2 TaxID=2908646 RepID=UPI001F222E75|nr:chromate transporter [Vibrio sp. SS-MA-C1-2]UJF17904.1 chromate transporter [Vibrio sp. SS-MA-C1-2]